MNNLMLRGLALVEDDSSWRQFFHTYAQLIYAVALKAALTDPEAQEVVQETVITVVKKMPKCHCDPQGGSFKGFLLRVTGWRITDQFRKRGKSVGGVTGTYQPNPNAEDRTATIDRVPDPAKLELETLGEEEWREHLLDIAGDEVLGVMGAKN